MKERLKVITCVFLIVGLLVGASAAQAQESAQGRLGFGLGVPYGGIGLNAELTRGSQIVPTVGLGWMPFEGTGIGWNVGARYYLIPSQLTQNGQPRGPRLTLMYGTSGLASDDDTIGFSETATYETLTGFTAGIGWQWEMFNLDLLFEFGQSSPSTGFTRSSTAVDASFGWMFKF